MVKDSIVVVTCEQLKIDTYDGKNRPVISIEMLTDRLGYVHSQQQVNAPQMNNGGFQQAPQQNQGGFQQAPQQQQPPRFIPQNQQQPANNGFDDDIAF